MSRTIACPEGCDLLALATEGAAPPAVRGHVDSCPSCLRELRRLRAEVVLLRSAAAALAPPDPASALIAAPCED